MHIHDRPMKGRRWWFLKVVAVLFVLAIAAVRLQPELERNIKGWITIGIVALALALVLIWFALLSRFPWRVRLITVLALGIAGFGISKSVRKVGTLSSVGLPKLAWKWSQPRQPGFATAPAVQAPPPPGANLPDVPQFFGPNRDGIVTGAKLARDWKATPPKQLWRQPVGAGWSAFAVVRRARFHAGAARRKRSRHLLRRAHRPAALVHAYPTPPHFSNGRAARARAPRPPSIAAGSSLIGATGILDCLDAATGQRVWTATCFRKTISRISNGASAHRRSSSMTPSSSPAASPTARPCSPSGATPANPLAQPARTTRELRVAHPRRRSPAGASSSR